MVPYPSFSDFIAKIRGGDNWPQAEALVFSRETFEGYGLNNRKVTVITFTYWVDGEIYTGEFDVSNEETDLNKDDTFQVQYAPTRPERHYYAPDAHGTAFMLKFWAIVILLVLLIAALTIWNGGH